MKYQPPALVGNAYSDAYFAALSRRPAATVPECAYCRTALPDRRVTDGAASWCSEDHRLLWVRQRRVEDQKRQLTERGWSPREEKGDA